MAPLFPNHPKFTAFLYTLLYLFTIETQNLLSIESKRRFQLYRTNMLASVFSFTILDASIFSLSVLQAHCLLCHLKDNFGRLLHVSMGNIYKAVRRQGETKVSPWPLCSLGDVSGRCWYFPTVPAHTWQLCLSPDAPAFISPPHCVNLGDPEACFVTNLETSLPSWSVFMSIISLAVLLVLWIKLFWCFKCWQLCILSRLSPGWFSSWEWQGTSASSDCLICQVSTQRYFISLATLKPKLAQGIFLC